MGCLGKWTRNILCNKVVKMAKIHGMSKTKEYISWIEMRKRCRNQNVIRYPLYGGAGITVCDRWYNSFELFLEDMGMIPEGKTSLDRYPDSNGNYEPGNCRWANDEEQANNKSNNVMVNLDGISMTMTQAERKLGLNRGTIQNRVRRGATPQEAVEMSFGRERRLYEYNGQLKNSKEWCKYLGITETTFFWRLRNPSFKKEDVFTPKANKPSRSVSGYKGVYKIKDDSFAAYILVDGKNKHLGCFKSAEDAAKVYVSKFKELYGLEPYKINE